jgi:hypothetical protein
MEGSQIMYPSNPRDERVRKNILIMNNLDLILGKSILTKMMQSHNTNEQATY